MQLPSSNVLADPARRYMPMYVCFVAVTKEGDGIVPGECSFPDSVGQGRASLLGHLQIGLWRCSSD